jgi:Na+/H+-translocating membrane pyrophosphatase
VGSFDVFLSIFSGTAVGILIGLFTEYYTSSGPMLKIAESSQTGPATNIITGFAIGLESTVTTAALKEMIAPGLTAVLAPSIVGLVLGKEALGGTLAGATLSGVLWALLMANAGRAWDNAKKYIEPGNLGGQAIGDA